MADDREIEIGGEARRLGCLSPVLQGRAFAPFPRWAADKPVWTLADVRAFIGRGGLTNRHHFPAKDWICNQLQTSACNGWSIAKALEKTRHVRGADRVKLSGSSLYAWMNDDRDQGSTLDEGMQKVQEVGCLPESMSRVDQIYKRQYPDSVWPEAKRFRAAEVYVLDNELELATALAAGYFPVVAVHVDDSFSAAGVDGVSRGGSGPGNHSVHLDGMKWSDQLGCLAFDLPNSWGTGWGDQGRTFVTWDRHLRPCRQYHQFFGIRDAVEDPKGDNPPVAS